MLLLLQSQIWDMQESIKTSEALSDFIQPLFYANSSYLPSLYLKRSGVYNES